ncbi:MAG: SulP family inorganic anion transporter, partial [Burkholderiales bacterium]
IVARFFPKSPALLIAVIIPTAAVYLFDLPDVAVVGTMPHHLPMPHLPDFSAITNWKALISSALVIFTLASLETLLSCSAIEKMDKNLSHKPDQELIGQGLANIGVALFGGIPVTEVIARSSVNIHAGAKTRRSAIIHSLIILAVIYACPQLIEGIPIAVLAGILLSAALKMMNIRELINFWKNDKLEVAVYLATFVTIVTTDLIDGIQTGIILALLIVAVRMLATKTSIKLWPNKQVLRISLGGNMTFWSFEKLNQIHQHIRQEPKLRFVVFEFESLNGIDSTGAKHLVDIAQEIAQHNIQVIFHGLTQEQERLLNTSVPEEKPFITTITESQIKQLMESSGITHSANDILKHGMEKFLDQYAHERQQLFDSLAKEQKPHTLLITCADSRLNPNAFFSVGLGEIFIVRNVGNVIPKFLPENKYSEGAAIEFALAGLTIRNVVICAHTECGAIKASLKDLDKPAQSGLDNWLQIIKDGFRQAKPQDIDEGVKVNLLNQVNNLKTYPLVIELLNKGELTISAWVYDVHSAQILEWDNAQQQFLPILKDNLQVAAM